MTTMVRTMRAGCALLLGLQLWGSAWAHDYYLKIDTIKGSSVQEQHKDWIDIDTFSWSVQREASSGGASKASFSELSWEQAVDAAVVPIFMGVAMGTVFKNATLDVVAANQRSAAPFFQMVFKDVGLTRLEISGSGGVSPSAEAALIATEITMRYWTQDATGRLSETPIEGTWSLKTNTGGFNGDIHVLTGLFLAGAASVDLSGLPLPTAPVPVPEPGSAALLLLGLLPLGWRARRARV